MVKKTAIIVGSNGQDGRLLAIKLSQLNYVVVGISRGDLDITDINAVKDLITRIQPDEIYYLAAHHHSSQDSQGESGDLLRKSFEVHVIGLINFLDGILGICPNTRLFYASSCLIFSADDDLQTELTLPKPEGAYAISKYAGMQVCKHYQKSYGIFASIGILYNHESPLRSSRFITQKIIQAALRIARDGGGTIEIGDLNALVDWGYAPEYVDAMYKILQLPEPDEYIIASGKCHSVREFAELAFSKVGLDYRDHIKSNQSLLTRLNFSRVGDATKLQEKTGWSAKVGLSELVHLMFKNYQSE